MMKTNTKTIKYLLTTLIIVFVVFLGFLGMNSWFGWYAYEHWKHRKASSNITESVKRGVFVKKLKFKVEGYDSVPFKFEPFIEKAFTWGYHSSDVTVNWKWSNYPYQFEFDNQPLPRINIYIEKDQLENFDSSNCCWGFLKEPKLKDTIILWVKDTTPIEKQIKVWN